MSQAKTNVKLDGKNIEMAVPHSKDSLTGGLLLSASCPGTQVDKVIEIILIKYSSELLVNEWQTLTQAVEQSLRILQKIKQTFICFDYKGSKARVVIDLSTSEIDPYRWTMILSGNKELGRLSKFIIDNTWDIHLPNWILKVVVEPWLVEGEFIFKAKQYRSWCDRAKRSALRVELNWNGFTKRYFKTLVKSDWEVSNGKKLPDNQFSVETENWVKIGIVKNISDSWLWIFLPKIWTSSIEIWKTFKLVLPFLTKSVKVDFTVKKINREHEGFCELWWAMYYIDPKDKELVSRFVWNTNKRIWEEFNALKEWHEWIEKIVITQKDS